MKKSLVYGIVLFLLLSAVSALVIRDGDDMWQAVQSQLMLR